MIYDRGFQNAFFIHNESICIHIHFVINSVSYKDGKKLTDIYNFQSSIRRMLKGYIPELKWL